MENENQNQNPKAQLIERLKQANNVLVTVSRNPSVDQLSAAMGLTLLLNQLDKHATAVFSGEVPNTLEFLKPEETLEKTTDSLRDFIISLDKAKADKLRYKVEDKMVKIFITPYRTSLSETDLVFGQGDFNVDVVVAIGVHEKEDLDQAITAHGRILHDAAVVTVNTSSTGQLGSINWVDGKASSLCEMLVPVCEGLKPGALDAQMSTAFLTGIVAETERFSNEKTSSDTMNISAKLMAAGANQQLVATKLEEKPAEQASDTGDQPPGEDGVSSNDGSLAIDHEGSTTEQTFELPEPQAEQAETPADDLPEAETENQEEKPSRLILEPPTLGGTLTASSKDELDPSTDPLTLAPVVSPLLSHDKSEPPVEPVPEQPAEPSPEPEVPPEQLPAEPEKADTPPEMPEQPAEQQPEVSQPAESEPAAEPADSQTLSDLEEAVDSPHVDTAPDTPDAQAALEAAHQAFDGADQSLEKPAAFNASAPMEVDHEDGAPETAETPSAEEPVAEPPADIQIDPETGNIMYPTNLVPPADTLPNDPTATAVTDPTAPPPVPPPMAMPPFTPPPNDPADPNNLPPVSQ